MYRMIDRSMSHVQKRSMYPRAHACTTTTGKNDNQTNPRMYAQPLPPIQRQQKIDEISHNKWHIGFGNSSADAHLHHEQVSSAQQYHLPAEAILAHLQRLLIRVYKMIHFATLATGCIPAASQHHTVQQRQGLSCNPQIISLRDLSRIVCPGPPEWNICTPQQQHFVRQI